MGVKKPRNVVLEIWPVNMNIIRDLTQLIMATVIKIVLVLLATIKHKKQQQQESELSKEKDSKESVARKTKLTKVIGKYVPPPGLWKK